ncbi:MAG: electron transfer flavoprotein subunit alpha, partial [Bacteroidetes bacterium RIFOXYB2_FULL_35_7]
MSVLVYTENWDGKFKKLSFELISYANEIAKKLNSTVVALSIGNVAEDELKLLGNYGATKVLSVVHDKIKGLDNQVFTSIIAQAVEKEKSTVVVFAHNNTGKAIAPRLSVRLKAGLVAGVTAVPASFKPFTVVKKVFTSKALSTVVVNTPVQIVTLLQNTYGIIETATPVVVEAFHPQIQDAEFTTDIKEVSKVTGKILLTDAEIVVSGGRGMKGPENWGIIEELASLLGAATACSRPVSD